MAPNNHLRAVATTAATVKQSAIRRFPVLLLATPGGGTALCRPCLTSAVLLLCLGFPAARVQGQVYATWEDPTNPTLVGEFDLLDASVGLTWTGLSGDVTAGSLTTATCLWNPRIEPEGTVQWSRSDNWGSPVVHVLHVKKVSDWISDPGNLRVVFMDEGTAEKTFGMEELTHGGPDQQPGCLSWEIEAFVEAGVCTTFKFDVGLVFGHNVWLDQNATIEHLTILENDVLTVPTEYWLDVRKGVENSGCLRGRVRSIGGGLTNNGYFTLGGSGNRISGDVINHGSIWIPDSADLLIDGPGLKGCGSFQANGLLFLQHTAEPSVMFEIAQPLITEGQIEAVDGFTTAPGVVVSAQGYISGLVGGHVRVQEGRSLRLWGPPAFTRITASGLVDLWGDQTTLEWEGQNSGQIEAYNGATILTTDDEVVNEGAVRVSGAKLCARDYVRNDGLITLANSEMTWWSSRGLGGTGQIQATSGSTLHNPQIEWLVLPDGLKGNTVTLDATSAMTMDPGGRYMVRGHVINEGGITTDGFTDFAGTLINNGSLLTRYYTLISTGKLEGSGSTVSEGALVLRCSPGLTDVFEVAQPLTSNGELDVQEGFTTTLAAVVSAKGSIIGRIGGHVRVQDGQYLRLQLKESQITPEGLVEASGNATTLGLEGTNFGRIEAYNGATITMELHGATNEGTVRVSGAKLCVNEELRNDGLITLANSELTSGTGRFLRGTGRLEVTDGSILRNPHIVGVDTPNGWGQITITVDETSSITCADESWLSACLTSLGPVTIQGANVFLFNWTVNGTGAGSFSAQGSQLFFSGDWIVQLKDPAKFIMGDVGVYFGGAPANSSQFLEVCSSDKGSADEAWQNNFAIPQLILQPNCHLALIDEVENAGAGDFEALYVDTLYLRSGAVLNTNGWHLYYKNLVNQGGQIVDARVRFDSDFDNDVDLDDLNVFQTCVSGPAVPHDCRIVCRQYDTDDDGDVDQADFGVIQRCYSGANRPADPNCAD